MEAVILSVGLDTNGQNTRYVRASEKFGNDPDVLSALAIGNDDPANVVYRYVVAAAKLGSLHIRSAHQTKNYLAFPHDIFWDRRTQPLIKQLAQDADLIHLNNSWQAAKRLGINRKPMLLHHHGSLFRNNTAHMLSEAKVMRLTQAVSTLDLTRPAPDILHWLPTAYDIAELQAYGVANRREPDGKVRIAHAPTNREYKATEALIAAVKDIPNAELDLIEGVTWAECMARKAKADILFDQLAWGYGCNAVEAWGMGIPVIAGADPWTTQRMSQEFGELPFLEASEVTLADVLRKAVKSKALREDYAAKGTAHVLRFHDEKPALTRLAEVYAKTIRNASRIRIPGKAATFTGADRPVYIDDERIRFPYTTDDPEALRTLRRLTARPVFGVKEEVA